MKLNLSYYKKSFVYPLNINYTSIFLCLVMLFTITLPTKLCNAQTAQPEKEKIEKKKDDATDNTPEKPKEKKQKKTGVGLAIAFGGPILILGVGSVNWYVNHAPEFNHNVFHFWDRGWFGKDTYTGGHDKLGHFTSNYIFQYAYTGAFEEFAGFERTPAIWTAAAINFISYNIIEIFDAFTEYGWEYGDTVMNILGQSLAILTQFYGLERFFQLRLSWVPSPDYIAQNEIRHYEFLEDYNGQRFFFLANTAGIADTFKVDLRFFKYIMPAIYYDTRGYRPAFPEKYYDMRERNLGAALVLDFSRIAYDIAPQSSFMRGLATFFRFYQPSIFVGYGYDFNHKRWHTPDLSMVITGPFDL